MLATLIAAIGQGSPAFLIRRILVAAISYVLIGVAALCGIGFLFAAAYIAAERRFGEMDATLGFGFGFLLLALVIYAIYRIVAAVKARRRQRERQAAQMSGLITTVLALLPTLLRSRAGMAELLAPIIAMVAYMIYKENTDTTGDEPPVK